MADHKWKGHKNPNTADDPGEWVEFCEVCGIENGGSGVDLPPCEPQTEPTTGGAGDRDADDPFPFEYVGGGHFRRKGVPVGESAELLHGQKAVDHVLADHASLRRQLESTRAALAAAEKWAADSSETLATTQAILHGKCEEVERLRAEAAETLRPFADEIQSDCAGGGKVAQCGDDVEFMTGIKVKYIRRAAAVLARLEGVKDEGK